MQVLECGVMMIIQTCYLAVQIDVLIREDKETLANMVTYAEDEPTAQRELHNRLVEATRMLNALYSGDYGSEDRTDMNVASQMQNKMHDLRAKVSIPSGKDVPLHTSSCILAATKWHQAMHTSTSFSPWPSIQQLLVTYGSVLNTFKLCVH